MSNWSKKWIYPILALLLIFGADRLYQLMTDDVRLSNMAYTPPLNHEYGESGEELTSEERLELAEITLQRYFYIGKGTQSYAFGSENGSYVLKFFNFNRLQPSILTEKLISFVPFAQWRHYYSKKQKRRLNSVFKGYALAFRETKESSGLIYVHLAPTKNLHLEVTAFDKIGRELKINLDDFVFVIQKKGVTSRDWLGRLLEQGDIQEAKRAITKILNMYLADYEKGVYDRDHNVPHNIGFMGSATFHIDSGRLEKNERMKQVEFYKKDFFRVVSRLNYWSRKYFPPYYSEISDLLSEEYLKVTGEFIDFKTIKSKHASKKQ